MNKITAKQIRKLRFSFTPAHPKFARIFEVARQQIGTESLRYIGDDGVNLYIQQNGVALYTIPISDL
jgi:hypothetical protein